MKYVFIKYFVKKGDIVTCKQKKAKVLKENYNSVVVEYLNEVTQEVDVMEVHESGYSKTPYLMDF